MSSSFTPELKKILLEAGCYFERQGKGDHEIWYSPITKLGVPKRNLETPNIALK